ncbi:relaxase domain-containing protein [Crossiella sp. SN42]|nr:relaxase domain-containing protein [Crossiella sp. SN42]
MDSRERPLVWLGKGLATVGIRAGSELTTSHRTAARRLRVGRHPLTGEQLVRPKLAVPHDAKVRARPLLQHIHAVAAEGAADVEDVLDHDKLLISWYETATREVNRRGDRAYLAADRAGRLADAAQLDVEEVWGSGVFTAAAANLFETVETLDDDGTVVTTRVKRRIAVGNAGYDITFTISKSASLLLAFARQPMAQQLEDIYAHAIDRAMAWLESTTCYVLRGKHGAGKSAKAIPAEGFLGWKMTHRAARPVAGALYGDPHWHVHVVIANLALGEDGQWSTIASGGRDLIRHAAAAGAIAQALIRYETNKRFGIRWERSQRTGAWEITGIPQHTIDRFSRRQDEIHAALTAMGIDPPQATQAQRRKAETQTRRSKDATAQADDELLRHVWQSIERDAGHNPLLHIARTLHHRDEAPPPLSIDEITQQLLDPDTGLTGHSRRFSRVDALARVADAVREGFASPLEIERLTDTILAKAGFIQLPRRSATDGEDHQGGTAGLAAAHMANAEAYSTEDVLEAEKVILRAAKHNPDDALPHLAIPPDTIELTLDTAEVARGHPLADEQAAALRHIASRGRALDTIQGGPGTGKTTTMDVLRAIYTAAGFTVAGAATAAVAAANLEVESGVHSRTVAQWRYRIFGPANESTADLRGLTGIDVLIVDEANLSDDRDRSVLYQEARRTGTKIIEVGDRNQLRGVGCGSLFGHVHEIVNGATLRNNRRQKLEDERAAIKAWRHGDYVDALNLWRDNERLIIKESGDEAYAAMLSTWLEQRTHTPDAHTELRGLILLAATNETVDRLNAAAQALRLHHDELGDSRTYNLGAGRELTIHLGDHVMMRANDRTEYHTTGDPVLNGYRGVVTGLGDRGSIRVEWEQDTTEGRRTMTADLHPDYIENGGLSLAYCMTIHKAEGLTVNNTWTLPAGFDRGGTVLFYAHGADTAGFHVATSRHSNTVFIFAARQDYETDDHTHLYGTPAGRDLQDRVIAQIADRARQTATHGDDRPIVVDLQDPEFVDEDGNLIGSHLNRTRDEPERVQQRQEQQQRTEQQHHLARRHREVVELLQDLWPDHYPLIERMSTESKFNRVIEHLDEATYAGFDQRAVLEHVPIETLATDQFADKNGFLIFCIGDAVRKIRQTEDKAEREAEQQQEQDQAADILREAWEAAPELADRVINSDRFDALVHMMKRQHSHGRDVHDLLSRLNLSQIAKPQIRDPATFTAYALRKLAERDQARHDAEARAAEQQAEHQRRLDLARDALDDIWGTHPAVHAVVTSPTFSVLAQRIHLALNDYNIDPDDVRNAIVKINPDNVATARRPGAYLVFSFTRNLPQLDQHYHHAPAPDNAPQQEPEATQPLAEPTPTEPASPEPPTPTPPAPAPQPAQEPGEQPEPESQSTVGQDHTAQRPTRQPPSGAAWQQRPYGHLTHEELDNRIAVTERALQHLETQRRLAEDQAAHLLDQADNETGPKLTSLIDELDTWSERAALAERGLELYAGYQRHRQTAEAAQQRFTTALYDRAAGNLSRDANARIEHTIAEAERVRRESLHSAEQLAEEASEITRLIGPPDNYQRIIIRHRALQKDFEDHARAKAVAEDHATAQTAKQHHELVFQRVVHESINLVELREEKQLRDDQPDPVRHAEELTRRGAARDHITVHQPQLPPPIADHQATPTPHPVVDIDPEPPPQPIPAPEP